MWNGRELEQKVARALDCIGKGAAALSEAGTTVFHMSNAMQKQGLSGLLQSGTWHDVADSTSSAPPRTSKAKSKRLAFEPQDNEERRAIIHLRLERAMAEQNLANVQQLSRELDEIEGYGYGARSESLEERSNWLPARSERESSPHGSSVEACTCHTPHTNVQDAAALPDITQPSTISSSTSRPACMHSQHYCVHMAARYAEHSSGSYPCSSAAPCCHRQCCHGLCSTRSEHTDCHPSDAPRHDRKKTDTTNFGTTTFSHASLKASGNGVGSSLLSSNASHESHCAAIGPMTIPSPQPPVMSNTSSNRAVVMHLDALERTASRAHPNLLHPSLDSNQVPTRIADLPQLHQPRGVILLPTPWSGTLKRTNIAQTKATLSSQTQASITAEPLLLTMLSTTTPHREVTCEPAQTESPAEPRSEEKCPAEDDAKREQIEEKSKQSVHQHEDFLRGDDDEIIADEESYRTNRLCDLENHLEQPLSQSAVQSMPEKHHQPECHQEIIREESTDIIGLPPLPDVYEVENILDVRKTADGKREFLIKWTGWGPSWNNWEPEEHILDRRLLRKFNKKKREEPDTPEQATTAPITIKSKRRCAKAATIKARAAAAEEGS